MKKLLDMAEQLSERYLISEVMELPEQAEDQVYYQLLKMAGKSMLEQIGEVERERLEYKEYIEQWIHEIKTPITAMKLLCENHRTDWTKELLLELEKPNRFTAQALYYARSEHIEKDYSVREMALYIKSKQQAVNNPVFKEPLHYVLDENGITISQGDSSTCQKWEDCLKAVSTGRSIIVYTAKNNATIFPKSQMQDKTTDVIEMISTHMPPTKVKIRS